MRKRIGVMAVLISLLAAGIALAGGQKEGSSAPAASAGQPTVLPMLFRQGGNDAETVLNAEIIKRFQEKYKGVYELKIEYVPGMAAEYRQKEKMLASANQLPVVVTDLAEEPAFAEQLMRTNMLADLKPYFDRDANWKKYALDASVAFNTAKGGYLYTAPESDTQYVGIFYNKDLFQKAGIVSFPTTWADFAADLTKLKNAGITPISLHTTETGWCTNLMLTAYLGRTDAGRQFMGTKYPSTQFTSPEFIQAVDMVKQLYQYTTSDAVGGTYALAANHFVHGDTAMIPNGPWMIPSFSDTTYSPAGFQNKVAYARFPGDLMISNQGAEYGNGVSQNYPQAVRDGGAAWLAFYYGDPEIIKLRMESVGSMTPKIQLTDAELAKLDPVTQSYYAAVQGVKVTIPWFQAQWDPVTQNETIVKDLPLLLYGQMTSQQYGQALADSAKQYLASQQQ